MAEQRKFIRLDSSIAVDYHLSGKTPHPPINTVTKNISAGGIRIKIKERLPVGSHLDIKLKLPGSDKDIPVVGEIVWVEPNQESGYDAGIKYIKIDPDDIQKITDYVLRCLGKRLTETQNRITVSKKAMMFLYKEIRMPGDNSQNIKAPSFLVDEVNLPGDKVRYAKISSSISLKYKIVSGDNHTEGTSLSQYVSGRGIWFLADKDIPADSILEVRIELPDSGIPIIATCIVNTSKPQTRYDDKQARLYYEVGIQFRNISVTDRKRIIRYVYNCKTDYMMIGKTPPSGWLRLE